MANLEKKGIDPMLAGLANWFGISILGYVLIGQTDKGIKVMIAVLIGSLCCILPGTIIAILGIIDVYQVALAVQNDEEVDEHEYKNELLYKIVKMLDKEAICKTVPEDEAQA